MEAEAGGPEAGGPQAGAEGNAFLLSLQGKVIQQNARCC